MLSVKPKRKAFHRLSLCMALTALASSMCVYADEIKTSDVRVVINGESSYYKTSDKTVGDFFQNNEITYEENSKMNVSLGDEITESMRIVIDSPIDVNFIIDGGDAVSFKTTAQTVGKAAAEFKKENNCEEYSLINAVSGAELTAGMDIELVSAEDRIETENEEIPFKTVKKETDKLDLGTEKVDVQGVTGIKKITKTVHYEGGKQVGEPEITDEKIMVEPVDEVILVGTFDRKAEEAKKAAEEAAKAAAAKKKAEEAGKKVYNGSSSSFTYTKCMTMNASAYAPVTACCGKSDGITASGMKARYGVVAVDPRYIKLGTKLYVEGYGYCIAADTGGAIKGNKIDLCYNTYSEALNYGRRNVKVYVLG